MLDKLVENHIFAASILFLYTKALAADQEVMIIVADSSQKTSMGVNPFAVIM